MSHCCEGFGQLSVYFKAIEGSYAFGCVCTSRAGANTTSQKRSNLVLQDRSPAFLLPGQKSCLAPEGCWCVPEDTSVGSIIGRVPCSFFFLVPGPVKCRQYAAALLPPVDASILLPPCSHRCAMLLFSATATCLWYIIFHLSPLPLASTAPLSAPPTSFRHTGCFLQPQIS